MNGQSVVPLSLLLSDTRPQFFLPKPNNISLIYESYPADYPAGTIVVTSTADIYVKLFASPDWAFVIRLTASKEPMYNIPHVSSASPTGTPLQTLPQYNYRHHSRARAPQIELTIPYHYVPLLSALDERSISSPDEPAFARDAPIGEKLSVCLWLKGICPRRKRTNGFSHKQYRVRGSSDSDGRKGRPITRAKLARLLALDVYDFMNRRRVVYHGSAVAFPQLCLKERPGLGS
ncbi:uncharacterized protein TRAVEDRAFT_47435 [Trametes versicolor FP-101664 SS1]|uniref:uncharacterized protein n=1 Tax=Trametes versicolor (strain FP-101664) TaxID=717944 RepID=UPI0004622C7A|nr:uncharacterized protein TRAVEDRAFT_47435 [Trametes versicolor FP-101664 SS1]EIW58270.1 hypothetical protein TRAVEDRAFT_47435 [Trametes versicolor FP-101664 SS1]